jgi:membrane protein implicated in regulation of membrane protease activity
MARPPFPNEHTYAAQQEVLRHDDAIISFGEMTACVMMWNIADLDRGDVTRCTVCYTPFGIIADAYQQPSKGMCTSCYGTSFQGGIRAIVYRPAMWVEDTSSDQLERRGQAVNASGTVQLTSDFMMRDGDYLVRSDGTYWRITSPQDNEIVTGFGPSATGSDANVAGTTSGSTVRVQLEDKSSIAYSLPINPTALLSVGWSPYMLYPSGYDVVNGSLLYGW